MKKFLMLGMLATSIPCLATEEAVNAVQALIEGGPKNTALIQERLFDKDRSVVQEAIRGLKKFDTRETRAALTAFAQDALPIYQNETKSSDRYTVLTALNSIESLGAYAAPAIAHLISMLQSDNYFIRRTTERTLSAIDVELKRGIFTQQVVPSVLKDLNDPDEDLRLQTLEFVKQLRQQDPQLTNKLLDLAKNDWFPNIRESAIQIVGPTKDPRLLPVLRGILEQREQKLYTAAGDALTMYGMAASTVAPALLNAFKNTYRYNTVDYRPLLKAMISLNTKEIADYLLTFKRDSVVKLASEMPTDRARAAVDLGLFGPAAADTVSSLRNLLGDPDRDVRAATMETLKKINTPEAQTALSDYKANRIPIGSAPTSPGVIQMDRVVESCDQTKKHLRTSRVFNKSALQITPRPTYPNQKRALIVPGGNNVVHLFWTTSESTAEPCDGLPVNLYFEMDRAQSIKNFLYSVGSFDQQKQSVRLNNGKIAMRPPDPKKNRFAGNVFLKFDDTTLHFKVDKDRISNVN